METEEQWYDRIRANICRGISTNTLPEEERERFWEMLRTRTKTRANDWDDMEVKRAYQREYRMRNYQQNLTSQKKYRDKIKQEKDNETRRSDLPMPTDIDVDPSTESILGQDECPTA